MKNFYFNKISLTIRRRDRERQKQGETERMNERDWTLLTSPTLCCLTKGLKLRLNKIILTLEQIYKNG